MATVNFNITNSNTSSGNESVLVFLKPINASSNFRYYAWQVKNPAPNGGQSAFQYSVTMAAQVANANQDKSRIVSVLADQLWQAQTAANQGLDLAQIVPLPSPPPITPQQVGIVNHVTDQDTLTATFFVDDNPVVDIPGLNPMSTVTFQLEAKLYFMAAQPLIQGPNYTAQVFSQTTPYVIPNNVSNVNVNWSRPGGVDTFTFDPPSAPLPPT